VLSVASREEMKTHTSATARPSQLLGLGGDHIHTDHTHTESCSFRSRI
jgi:hypothetical protein